MPPMRKPAAAARKPAAAAARSRTPAPRASKAGEPSEASRGLVALLLGLERRQDRRTRCEDMLKKEVPWLQFEFFPATDGKAHTIPEEEVAKSWNTKCNALYGEYEDIHKDGVLVHSVADFKDPGVMYDFSPGERGCAHSHYRMWQRAVDAPGPLLVLEDDVQLIFKRTKGGKANGKVFTQRLNLAMAEAEKKKDVDVLYLGWAGYRDGNYKHHKAQRGKKNDIIRKAEYVWTTVAYVIWPAGAKKLLDASKPLNQPVDNFMAWEASQGRLNSYVVLDEGDADGQWEGGIVAQCDFLGDSDIKKSDGGHQNDDPTAFLTKDEAAAPPPPEEAPAAEGGEPEPAAPA